VLVVVEMLTGQAAQEALVVRPVVAVAARQVTLEMVELVVLLALRVLVVAVAVV
jgi:hypothetical protein